MKIMISQPMKGKTEEQIMEEREELVKEEDEREFKIKRLEGRIEEWNVQNAK